MAINTLQGAWETNTEVRPERDWEKLEGRSVIKEEQYAVFYINGR